MKFNLWWRWVILAGLVLGVLFIPFPSSAAAPTERVVTIYASRFEYSPAVIKVNPGDRVTIKLVANDVVHGLSIDGYNLSTSTDPGQTASLSFIANRPGTFRFHCTVTCGNLHPFMTGKLEVGGNIFFWRAFALIGLAIAAGVWTART